MPAALTNLPAWPILTELAETCGDKAISAYFSKNPERADKYSIQLPGLLFDYSKNRVSDEVLKQLLALAKQSDLAAKIQAMFAGENINTTEGRAVLHTALRSPVSTPHSALVDTQLEKMRVMSEKIRSGSWLGSTGKAITDVINIGIGGSDLGPKMAYQALREYAHPSIKLHFISNVDGAEILSLLPTLNPETTLVIIASKTFTTQETLINAKSVLAWLESELNLPNAQSSNHFIGITATPPNAVDYGILPDNILEFWDWVGGRYSVWSSLGLAVAIGIGFGQFKAFLDGAHEIDQHFITTPFEQNLPVLMALLGIWYSNFLGAQSHAVIPYCERLGAFVSYLQQMDMESNGKRVTSLGMPVNYTTGPIIWGQPGTNGQHAFFQLLHQGTHLVPIDFIAVVTDKLSNEEHHQALLGNMLAQAAALMDGQQSDATPAHKIYPGNKPSNILLLDELSPKTLGMLVATYEHKVFVQGAIWGVNSFDQWGVELGKTMAKALMSGEANAFDPSTERLFKYIN